VTDESELRSRREMRRRVDTSPKRRRKPAASAKLALNQLTTRRAGLPDDVTVCRESGIRGIGLWRWKLADFGEERAVYLLEESGLHVTSLSWAGGFTGFNGYSFREAVADGREALQLASRVASDCLVVVSGPRNGHTGNYARRLVLDGLKSLADEAADSGVAIALQPMHPIYRRGWSFLNSLDDAMELLQRCDHPAVKLALDVYHVGSEPRLLERLPDVVPHLAVVQLSDGCFPPVSQYDRRLPGDGEIPLAAITRTLTAKGYRRFFEIALWSRRLWQSEQDRLVDVCLDRFGVLVR